MTVIVSLLFIGVMYSVGLFVSVRSKLSSTSISVLLFIWVIFVLIVPNGSAASDSDLAKLQVVRARFPGTFAAATWMRGSIDESMRSRAGAVRIAHVPLGPNTEPVQAFGSKLRRYWNE